MKDKERNLGRLVAVHPIAPIYVQRAVFMAVLSFLFFLAMMFAFYVMQSALYFLLSTAFLIIYLLTMFSFLMQRKKSFEIYENGFRYRKEVALWNELDEVSDNGEIKLKGRKPIIIPQTLSDFDSLVLRLKSIPGDQSDPI
jgi:Ca2+/Na+ antiporter